MTSASPSRIDALVAALLAPSVSAQRTASLTEQLMAQRLGQPLPTPAPALLETDRAACIEAASPLDYVAAIGRLAKEERGRAVLGTLMDRLPVNVDVDTQPDLALAMADGIEDLVGSAPTTISGKGGAWVSVAARLFDRLVETDKGFKGRLAHTTLALATSNAMRWQFAFERFGPHLRAADQDDGEALLVQLAGSFDWELKSLAKSPVFLAKVVDQTSPDAMGAAQLMALSRGKLKHLTQLLEWAPNVPWPIVETAQALAAEEQERFLKGLVATLTQPAVPPRSWEEPALPEPVRIRLYQELRAVRPFVAELEPRFLAEDRDAHLAQRPGTASRPRPRG